MSFVPARFVIPPAATNIPPTLGCSHPVRTALGCPGVPARPMRGLGFPWGTIIGAGVGATTDILRSRGGGSNPQPAMTEQIPGTFDANGNYVVGGSSSGNGMSMQQVEAMIQQGIQSVRPAGNIIPAGYPTTQASALPGLPGSPSPQLISGVSNSTLLVGAGVAFSGLMLLMNRRK